MSKLLYLIAPYSDGNIQQTTLNVHKVAQVAGKIIDQSNGYFIPIVIHAEGWWIETKTGYTSQSTEYWYKHTLEVLKRCDAALIVGNIGHSKGSLAERAWCIENDVPYVQVSDSGLENALEYLKWKLEGER